MWGVFQAGDELGFALEALHGRLIEGDRPVDDLEGDVASDTLLNGTIDRGHAAVADFLHDQIRPQTCADHAVSCRRPPAVSGGDNASPVRRIHPTPGIVA
jgi:hypothetical protein